MIVGANFPWQNQDTESGLIMPWFVLPCLQWLKKVGVEEWSVFEYGCGMSSPWWKVNSFFHTAVDHDLKWAKAFNAKWCEDEESYVKQIHGFNVNCVIVDGKWRFECMEEAIKVLPPQGYLIIDNWNGEDFPNTKEALEILKDWECQIFKQPNHSNWQTAIFRKPNEL